MGAWRQAFPKAYFSGAFFQEYWAQTTLTARPARTSSASVVLGPIVLPNSPDFFLALSYQKDYSL